LNFFPEKLPGRNAGPPKIPFENQRRFLFPVGLSGIEPEPPSPQDGILPLYYSPQPDRGRNFQFPNLLKIESLKIY